MNMVKRKRVPLFLTKNYCYIVTIFLIIFVNCVVANWWLLGIQGYPPPAFSTSPSISYRENCERLLFLDEKQKELCSVSDKILVAIGVGAKIGIEECQHQFRMSRWNCTTYHNTTSIFGGILSVSSRESAYIHSVTSAGVAYAITRSCSRGELNECSCDHKRRKTHKSKKNWKWGGCSEDINFGEKFSRDFVDSKEDTQITEGLINQHNNEAGRKIVKSRMQRVCKCHGMSGSCNAQVCWRKLPSFRDVGDTLSARYEGAILVKVEKKKQEKGLRFRPVGRDIKKPNKTELVFLEDSPNYCERNETLGIMGTKGRLCNQGSLGVDGCTLLCCGRGYQIRVREVEEKCKCRFVWCCNVVCDTCKFKKEEYVCN